MRRVLLVFLAAPTLAGCPALAPPADGLDRPVVRGPLAERLDAHLRNAAAAGFSGAVPLARGGTVLLHNGYGLADRERGTPVTTRTVFDIGSMTKPLTATAVLHLQEEGRLSVDDPVTRFFENVPDDKRGITVRHLLTHTAGLPDALSEHVHRQVVRGVWERAWEPYAGPDP